MMEKSLIEISLLSGFSRNFETFWTGFTKAWVEGALHTETMAISSSSSVLVSLLAILLGMGRLQL